MIILDIGVKNSAGFTVDGRRWLRGITKQTLRHTAEFWHRTILAKHFAPSARFAYRYEPRNRGYLEGEKKDEGVGEGKIAYLRLKGKSRRFMLAFVSFSASSKRASVTMRPPFYFRNPFVGTRTDPRTGRKHTITRQPDKPAEVTAQTTKDKRLVRDEAAREMQRLMRETMPVQRKRIKG